MHPEVILQILPLQQLLLEEYLANRPLRQKQFRADVTGAIAQLHSYYVQASADQRMDVQFILEATSLLMAGCRPQLSPA